jgi:hypothetical protein
MSGKLIFRDDSPHDFRDDLESTIYILLWVALMYSRCSDGEKAVGFLDTVLDPQPRHGHTTYTTKPDFLMGRAFLNKVKFPDRPCLDQLLADLALLFSVRYEPTPTRELIKTAEELLAGVEPGSTLLPFLEEHHTVIYVRGWEGLASHRGTIGFFNEALRDRSQWPLNDRAEKQDLRTQDRLSSERRVKTTWSSTLVSQDLKDLKDDSDNEEDARGIFMT